MDIKQLRQQAKNLDPVIRIGKNGLNENVFAEIDKLLKKRKLIKIKVLNNCPDEVEEIIPKCISKTSSELILKIGNVFCLYRIKKL